MKQTRHIKYPDASVIDETWWEQFTSKVCIGVERLGLDETASCPVRTWGS